jgi:hypothetical protein
MMFSLSILAVASLTYASQPVQFITAVNRTQPLTLAIAPACGSISDAHFAEVNTGITLNATKYLIGPNSGHSTAESSVAGRSSLSGILGHPMGPMVRKSKI